MPTVVLVDTNVFLNVLNVPKFNQDRDAVLAELGGLLALDVNMLLPFAAIIETGNHIAQLSDGRLRRKFANDFCHQVRQAIDGTAPWTPTQGVETAILSGWLHEFPTYAMRGVGLGDLSIIKEYEAACDRHPNYRVRIWSRDQHLMAFDRPAPQPTRRRP